MYRRHLITRALAPLRVVERAHGIEFNSTLELGGAGASLFCGRQFERIHRDGNRHIVENSVASTYGDATQPLSMHTSLGVLPQMEEFLNALRPHLPWQHTDWRVTMQLEGASAVHAACEELLCDHPSSLVAVADRSYHGPVLCSYGAGAPWGNRGIKRQQVTYPAPVRRAAEPHDTFIARMKEELDNFVSLYSGTVRVVLIEPQFGSSLHAFPWPRDLLLFFAHRAKSAGMRIICDEVMCAARHGQGGVFLSRAWDIPADAVVFGKALGGGVHPFAGAAICRARAIAEPPHWHTYSGASALALSAATQTLGTVPRWHGETQRRSLQCRLAFRRLAPGSRVSVRGQGLLWGVTYSGRIEKKLMAACQQMAVSAYFVPGGALLTPPLDVSETQLGDAMNRFVGAINKTESDGI